MALQWWIDTAGKLVPLGIAAAVLQLNRDQAKFQRDLSLRATRIEDQKLRLGLLDRRLIAIEAIRNAREVFNRENRVTEHTVQKAQESLNAGRLVFEQEHVAQIEKTLIVLSEWIEVDHKINNYSDHTSREFRSALDRGLQLQSLVISGLHDLEISLTGASRIEAVPLARVSRRTNRWLYRFGASSREVT